MWMRRLRQFYRAITAKVTKEDMVLINKFLDKEEKALFFKMAIYEQKHCLYVASDINKKCTCENINKDVLIKAALLHDIGKINKPLTIIDRSILVILDKLSKGSLRKLSNIKKVDVYYNHASMGYEILKQFGYSKNFLYLIKNHHSEEECNNKELVILKKFDEEN